MKCLKCTALCHIYYFCLLPIQGKLNAILEQKEPFLDLSKIQTHLFKDLDYQKKYFDDREKINLYYALVNTGGRKVNVRKPSWLGLIALFFSIYVRIYHIPRLLKLKFLPGLGKQNYT